MQTVYLDWAATAIPDFRIAADCAHIAATRYFNPSSPHAGGKSAAQLLEEARKKVADSMSCRAQQVVFTSGATEANNMVVTSELLRRRPGSVVVSGIEHASVFAPAQLLGARGVDVRVVPAGPDGIVDPGRIAAAVDASTTLVAIMLVNNETGVIQPVRSIASCVRSREGKSGRRIHIHCDAVQAFLKIPVEFAELGVDSLAVSGHKVGAPRGAGALILQKSQRFIFTGGGQERGMRPGTENLAAIWGMARAAEAHRPAGSTEASGGAAEKWRFLSGAIEKIPGSLLLPARREFSPEIQSPYILMASFPPLPGEVLVRVMSDRGYYISTGSACSSRSAKRTRALTNMGVEDSVAASAVRISIGPTTTMEQLEAFCLELSSAVAGYRKGVVARTV